MIAHLHGSRCGLAISFGLALSLCMPALASMRAPAAKTVLPNGLRLIIRPDPSIGLVGISLAVGAGWGHEPRDKAGLARLLAATLVTAPDGDPGKAMRALRELSGKDIINKVDATRITLAFTVPSDRVGAALEVVAQLADSHNGCPVALETVRGRLVRSLQEEAEAPIQTNLLHERFLDLAYGTHPYAPRRDITIDGLQKAAMSDVSSFHEKYFQPNNMVLSVVGDVKEGAILEQVKKLFGGATAAPAGSASIPPVPAPTQAMSKEVADGTTGKTYMEVGFMGPGLFDRERAAFELLVTLLATGRSSRLHRLLVDREHVCDSVEGHYRALPEASPASFAFGLRAGDPEMILRHVAAECERLRREDVTTSELNRARTLRQSAHALDMQKRGMIAAQYAATDLVDEYDTVERFSETLEQVTVRDVRVVAEKYLAVSRIINLVQRPPSTGQGDKAHRLFQLPNGMRLVVKPSASSDLVGMSLFVKGGPRSEQPAEQGASTILARLWETEGSSRRPGESMARALEDLGAVLHVAAHPDGLVVNVNATVFNHGEVLPLIHEVLTDPSLDERALGRARTWLVDQYRELEQSAFDRGLIRLMSQVFDGHPYARFISGTPQTTRGIDLAVVRAVHQRMMVPTGLVLAVTGNVDPDTVHRDVLELFGKIPSTGKFSLPVCKPVTPLESSQIESIETTTGGEAVLVGFKLPAACQGDLAPISVCLHALGIGPDSLLGKRLAAIDPSVQLISSYQIYEEGSLMILGARVGAGKADEVRAATHEILAAFVANGAQGAQIEKTRELVRTLFLRQAEDVTSAANHGSMALAIFGDETYFDTIGTKYAQVTQQRVAELAREYLKHHRTIVVKLKK